MWLRRMIHTASKMSTVAAEAVPAASTSAVVSATNGTLHDIPSQQQAVASTSLQSHDAPMPDASSLVEPLAAPIERTSSKRARVASIDNTDVTPPQDKLVKLDTPQAVKPQLASIFAPSNSLKGKERAIALEDTPGKCMSLRTYARSELQLNVFDVHSPVCMAEERSGPFATRNMGQPVLPS